MLQQAQVYKLTSKDADRGRSLGLSLPDRGPRFGAGAAGWLRKAKAMSPRRDPNTLTVHTCHLTRTNGPTSSTARPAWQKIMFALPRARPPLGNPNCTRALTSSGRASQTWVLTMWNPAVAARERVTTRSGPGAPNRCGLITILTEP